MNLCACVVIARTTSGCACPADTVAMPAQQASHAFPSTSSTTAPAPLAMTNGALRGYDGEIVCASRARIASAWGPGGGTLMWGTFMSLSCFLFRTEVRLKTQALLLLYLR